MDLGVKKGQGTQELYIYQKKYCIECAGLQDIMSLCYYVITRLPLTCFDIFTMTFYIL